VGVLGAHAALTRVPWLIPVVCFVGAAFLLCYGVLAARRALRPGALLPDAAGARTGVAVTVATCLALTWLNPHRPRAWRVLDGGIAVVMATLAVSLAVRGVVGA
jgi:L-lysine exporter family protein LysE/ArgO